MLDICLTVAKGSNLWGFTSDEAGVLYLALEDNYQRIQRRITTIRDENVKGENLHVVISSYGLYDGLIEQIQLFIKENPNIKLIVIDTLECIRNGDKNQNIYSSDYQDIKQLRTILESHGATIILVHHTRKMFDPDPLNMLSGSTGLTGAVDGVWVLQKASREGNKGKLTINNRDTKSYGFNVEFIKDECQWVFLSNIEDEEDNKNMKFIELIGEFVTTEFKGTATELVHELKKINPEIEVSDRSIAKKLKDTEKILKETKGITYTWERSSKSKLITLTRN